MRWAGGKATLLTPRTASIGTNLTSTHGALSHISQISPNSRFMQLSHLLRQVSEEPKSFFLVLPFPLNCHQISWRTEQCCREHSRARKPVGIWCSVLSSYVSQMQVNASPNPLSSTQSSGWQTLFSSLARVQTGTSLVFQLSQSSGDGWKIPFHI